MSKRDEIEPLYAGLKDAEPSKLSLPARTAVDLVLLGLPICLVWLRSILSGPIAKRSSSNSGDQGAVRKYRRSVRSVSRVVEVPG